MRKVYFVLAMLTGIAIHAQSIYKIQYHEPTEISDAVAHCATSDGGSILASVQHPSFTVDYSISIIKTDASGTIQWTKKFDTDRPGFRNIVQSPDGTYFLCYSEFPLGDYYEMIRLDANGNVLYDKRINLPSRRVWQCITVAKRDSGFYVGCSTTDTLSGVAYWSVFEVTAGGTVVWAKDFLPDVFLGALTGMQLCNNNDLLLLGAAYHTPSQSYRAMVSRITPSGTMLWTTHFGYTGHDLYAADAVPNGSGFFVSVQDYDQNVMLAAIDFVGIDSLGTITWGMRYTPNTNSILPYDLVAAGNNQFAIVGQQSGPQLGSVFLKVDGTGQYLSSRFYPKYTTMSLERHNAWQFSQAATRDSLNEHYLTLYTTDLNGAGCDDTTAVFGYGPVSFNSGTMSGFYNSALNPVTGNLPLLTMNVVPGVLCIATAEEETLPADGAVSVYPVPSASIVSIEAASTITAITVTDLQGRVIETRSCQSNFTQINVALYAAGIYLLNISTADGSVIRRIEVVRE